MRLRTGPFACRVYRVGIQTNKKKLRNTRTTPSVKRPRSWCEETPKAKLPLSSRGKSPHYQIANIYMASGCPSSEPDAEANLIALRATYKAAEAKLNELRNAGADRTAIAHAADSLRALVPQLHALQVGSKKHRRSNNKNGSGRAAAFRRFLISTFGRAEMASGSGVLDVCGGQGGLAFELLNLHDVPVTVIDPGATNEAAIGGRGRTVRRFERQFEHVRRVQTGSQASLAGGAEELSQGEAASETGQSKQHSLLEC